MSLTAERERELDVARRLASALASIGTNTPPGCWDGPEALANTLAFAAGLKARIDLAVARARREAGL